MIFNPAFIIEWCCICSQGWVEIVKEKETGLLYCRCSECEAEWSEPSQVKMVPPMLSWFGKVVEPTLEEIQQRGWDKYTKGADQ